MNIMQGGNPLCDAMEIMVEMNVIFFWSNVIENLH